MKTFFVKTVCKALGAGHLVAQTTADALVNTEASVCHKFLNKDKSETIAYRKSQTSAYQQKMNDAIKKQAAMFKQGKLKALPQP